MALNVDEIVLMYADVPMEDVSKELEIDLVKCALVLPNVEETPDSDSEKSIAFGSGMIHCDVMNPFAKKKKNNAISQNAS